MRISFILRGLFAALFLFSACAVAAIDDPQAVLRSTADRVLAELSERKAELEADPQKIYPLVQETILPHFDFRKMSQSALGRFWRNATDAQKEGVTIEFRQLLVRTYATALLGYTGQEIEYLPVNYKPGDTNVTIPTRIASDGAPPIPINYRLTLNDDKWLVYDVVIDGVSLVTNYRSQFAAEVRRGGIDGLISTLASKNRKGTE